MSDITPLVSEGSQIVQAYGNGGFRVTNQRYEGSILVTPLQTVSWPITALSEATLESFDPLYAATEAIDILFLGCGKSIAPVAKDLRLELRKRGTVLELMDTGAACRTYNVTLTEGRRVAAALIAID